MKKIFSFLYGLLVLAMGLSAQSNGEVISVHSMLDQQASTAAVQKRQAETCDFDLAPNQTLKLTVQTNEKLVVPNSTPRKVKRNAPAKVTAANIGGYYVGTYVTLTSNSFDGGSTMQIVPDAEGDSITINSFWNSKSVRAHVDAATNTVTIPRQQIMVDDTYGRLDLAVTTYPSGAPDYAAQITGKLTDGGIDFSEQLYGIYVQTGPNKDRFIGAYSGLVMEVPNGTMEFTREQNGQTAKSGYYVVINQTGDNLLEVTNIFNWGLKIQILLNRDRTAEITNQTAAINSSGSWVMIKCLEFNDAGNLTKYSATIATDPAAEDNNTVLEWTNWSLLCAQASSYMGNLLTGKLTAMTPFKYPALSVSGFEGSGTEADPYQLSTRDHFILLADKVKESTEVHGEYYGSPVVSAFYGKHFAITQDIDFGNYRLDPIGIGTLIRFGGNVDGCGHTLKNVYADGGSKYYAGLFGVCDTISTLKNINIENLKVTSDYYSAGGLVAYHFGNLSNITVVNPTITSSRAIAGGIGGVTFGEISNCKVIGGTVVSAMWVGGMIAESHGPMTDCDVEGTTVYMTGSGAPAGGVVGNLIADGNRLSFGGILSYKNTGGQQFLGGVAGYLQSCTLRNSYSGGQVIGASNESYVGGLVGYCRANVENCYSSGLVHCYTRKGGGLIGMIGNSNVVTAPVIKNCYTSATTEVETYQYNRENCNEIIGEVMTDVEVTLENLYVDRQYTNYYSTRFASNTEELTSAEGPKGFSSENWIFEKGKYPRLKGTETRATADFSASALNWLPIDNYKKLSNNTPVTALGNTKFSFLVKGELSTKGHFSEIKDNKMLEIGTEFGNDTLFITNGKMQTYRILAIAPIPFEGEGTEDSPFLLKSKDDLVALSEATTVRLQNFPGQYFQLANDIDMELTEDFLVINGDPTTAANQFQGVLDGNGHTIHRLNVAGRVGWTTPRSEGKQGTLNTSLCKSYSGLIGRLGENGVVKNLTIAADSQFELYGTCAAFVGTSNGLIENCRNYADVLGYSCWVGGIVGQMNKGSITRNCYNAGHIISCYANAGGIAGAVTTSTVENCVNTGDVDILDYVTNYNTQRQRAGGIAGGTTSGGVYRNCVNFGTVYAILNNVGGVVAALEESGSYESHMQNCINVGNVYCGNKATTGAVAGLSNSKHVSNVYYDVQNIGVKAAQNDNLDGVTPATTAFLTSGKAIEGFDAELWDFTEGMYPTLKQYAAEPKVVAARKVYLTMPENLTVGNLLGTAQLSNNATWTLDKEDTFKIEGDKLVGPTSVESVLTANLTAVNEAGVSRRIELTAMPVLKLQGEGTEAKPYLVNNVEDWTALCSYVNATGDRLDGQFVLMTGDLDFSGVTPARLGGDGITSFGGSFDGGNHAFRNVNISPVAVSRCALFGTVLADAVVKNFTFEGTVTNTTINNPYVAPVVDKLYGTIENVESKAEVNNAKSYTSGVVGNAYNGAVMKNVKFSGSIESLGTYIGGVLTMGAAAGHITMTDCSFTGKIKSTYKPSSTATSAAIYVGGLVSSLCSADLTNCYSDGEIDIDNTAVTTTVAGLVANATGNKDFPNYTFTNCYNATSVTAGAKVAGLVAGVTTTAANAKYVFTDCYNTGDISSKSLKSISSCPTAGIITNYTPGSRFTRCYNEGTILSDKNIYVGGIVASYTGTPGAAATPDSVIITGCYNKGLIVGDGNQAAGVVTYVTGSTKVEYCYNEGDIEGNQMAGGVICAFAGTGPQLINCHNTGNVTTKFGRAAGVAAWGGATNGVIKNCWNAGNISSTAEVGGTSAANGGWAIGGISGNAAALIENCYNVGTITGKARVGGIVGEPTKAKTIIVNSYNAGKIVAPADTCGAIIGVTPELNGKVWTAGNKVENCYYVNDFEGTLPVVEGAKAVSVTELAGMKIPGMVLVDDYSFPVVAGYEAHKKAAFHAAQVVPAEGDTHQNITKAFKVGGVPHVTWTSNCPALTISGNDAQFTSDYTGKITLTATTDELSKTVEVTASATSGVEGLEASDILGIRYFNAAGVEVAKESLTAGDVYVTVTTYTDGTVRTAKVIYND